MTESKESPQDGKHHIRLFPAWITKMLGSLTALFALVLIGVVGVGVWFGAKIVQRQDKADKQIEIVTTNLQVLHEQVIIRDIVGERLPKLNPETQARLAFEIYDGARNIGAPSWLILALIEKESNWELNIVSPAGAMGLFQLMPGTAMAYARIAGVTVTSPEQIKEPIFNARTGIRVLKDNYQGAIVSGKSPEGDFTRALWFYNGKGEAYARLVMEKAAYYQKRLQSPIQGKIKVVNSTES